MHAGGQLQELYKDSGNENQVQCYRDIMLSSDVGKSIQSVARLTLNEIVTEESVGTQWGSGLNDGDTEAAHLYTKAVIGVAKKNGFSRSYLFRPLDCRCISSS